MSSQVLSISRDGLSTASLGSPFQCSTILTVEKKSLCFKETSRNSLCAHCPLSCSWVPIKKSLAPPSLLPISCLYTFMSSFPLRLLLCKLNNSSSLSFLLHDRSLWSCTGHAPVYPCLSYTGEPCTGLRIPDMPHQCCVKGKADLLRLPGNVLPSSAQGAVGLLSSKGTLLACLQLVHQNPQILFWSAPPVLVHGIVPPQGLDVAFAFVDLHEVTISPFLQKTQIWLNGSATAWCISHYSQISIICKPDECLLWLIVQVINRDVRPCWAQIRSWGMQLAQFHATDHTSLSPAGQPASFQSTAAVFSAQRSIGLFRCDFPFTNPCWLLPALWFPELWFPGALVFIELDVLLPISHEFKACQPLKKRRQMCCLNDSK